MSHSEVGGQAVIEGVMIRSPQRISTAVRKQSGEILVKNEATSWIGSGYFTRSRATASASATKPS